MSSSPKQTHTERPSVHAPDLARAASPVSAAIEALSTEALTPQKAQRLVRLTRRQPLSDEAIVSGSREYFHTHGKLPTAHSREPVPGLPGESWSAIDRALSFGFRGFAPGRSLSRLLQPLRVEFGLERAPLSRNAVFASCQKYVELYGRVPTRKSTEPVPGFPDETWVLIDSAGHEGRRGLAPGESLARIVEPLREELKLHDPTRLSHSRIIGAIREYYGLHGRLPSEYTQGEVPGIPGTSWKALSQSCRDGYRGLPEGGPTLGQILASVRDELPPMHRLHLTEDLILLAARSVYENHKVFPCLNSKEEVPGFPDLTWRQINSAGRDGRWGLAPGRTLAKILRPLREELGIRAPLSIEKILGWALKSFRIHGHFPTQLSKEPVPGMPHESWSAIAEAASLGLRGLPKGLSLSKMLAPLKQAYGVPRKKPR